MTKLTPAARQVLRELEEQGSSEASAVAECLRNIADNGQGQETDAFLATCALEIAQHALAVPLALRQRSDRAFAAACIDFLLKTHGSPEGLVALIDRRARNLNLLADERFIRLSLGVADVLAQFCVDDAEAATFLQSRKHDILDRLNVHVQNLLCEYGEIDELPLVLDTSD